MVTTQQMIGALLLALPTLAIIGGTGVAMARQFGSWRVPLAIWSVSLAVTAAIVTGAYLLTA
ncbi:hypothetical protein [Micromonospora sp. 4G55]|uniref:hypothetical protein n=1 Tax=Micromonospora sp. 4G55 TaxID=2806102 RepID=UPI001A5FB630|nr:hypothetical protein [Micromonospora sp. 4G55]MBM0257368.1 hypothetical protein [Micromonospora sp. 4G55]